MCTKMQMFIKIG